MAPSATLGYECRVCGGPRVRLAAPEVQVGPASIDALRQASLAHTRVLTLSAIGWFLAAVGLLALLVALLVVVAAAPGTVATSVTLVISSLPSLAGGLALRGAAQARRARRVAMQRAELAAAGDILRALGDVSSARLASILGVADAHAETLLAEAQVGAFLEPPSPSLSHPQSAAPGTAAASETDCPPASTSPGRTRAER